jgi:hypothetical protein
MTDISMSSPATSKGPRRKGLIIAGALTLLGGGGGGLALLASAGSTYTKAVEGMARAPIGCTTALEFDEAGEFFIYIETKGRFTDVGGNCGTDDDYEFDDDDLPRVRLDLVDDDGDEVDLDRDKSASYDVSGFVGTSIQRFEIEDPGSYLLRVESAYEDFGIAVGRNPQEDVAGAATIGLIVAAAGVLIGGLLLVLGLRRKPVVPTPSAGFGTPMVDTQSANWQSGAVTAAPAQPDWSTTQTTQAAPQWPPTATPAAPPAPPMWAAPTAPAEPGTGTQSGPGQQ